jgi:hypothetical protein
MPQARSDASAGGGQAAKPCVNYRSANRGILGSFRAGQQIRWRVRQLMTEEEQAELKTQLERLRQEHRDLDSAIDALQTVPGSDILQVQRLKKRKLVLRDRITFIEDQLTPDIIA